MDIILRKEIEIDSLASNPIGSEILNSISEM